MAVTVNTQCNPVRDAQGTKESDATVITSGETTGTILYKIARLDGQGEIIVGTGADTTKLPQVVELTATNLKIILPSRTWFKACISKDGGAYGAWSEPFHTRDKKYSTPDAITQLTDTEKTSDPTDHGSKTITVTNGAKATIYTSSTDLTANPEGNYVVNSDTGYNDTTSVVYTSAGATVTNTTRVTETASGATVDNT